MDKFLLNATARNIIGKKVKVLRKEGLFPAVIYGRSLEKPVPIKLDLIYTTKALRTASESTIISLMVDDKEYTVLVRDSQFDVLLGTYIHLDFLAVSADELVKTNVGIILEGIAPAVESLGAMIIRGIYDIEVEALPANLPGSITVDISELASFGDGIYVRDIELSDDVTILSGENEMIVVTTTPTLIEEEEEIVEEGIDGEPEVIGEVSEEEDEV
jgi:large subunit ribosomal protein L25